MSLSTLVISDLPDMTQKLETLINDCNDLTLAAVSTEQQAPELVLSVNPRVIWIALSAQPEASLNLLSSLKEKHGDKHFLVSNETLEADLVKKSMQLGATDFLDAKTWSNQLPDVTSRVMAKEITVQKELKHQEEIKQMLEAQRSPRTTNPGLQSIRKKTGELELSPAGSSTGTIAGVVILLILVVMAYFMFFR